MSHNRKRKSGCLPVLLLAVALVLIYNVVATLFGGQLFQTLNRNHSASGGQSSLSSAMPDLVMESGTDSKPQSESDSEDTIALNAVSLHSTSAILVRLGDNSALLKKQSEQKIYPASLTKMMTAIVAIEKLPNLQKKINLQAFIFQPLYKENASMAGFQPGEEVPAIDLLYGALLPSGAECCIGLADAVSGSEQSFVDEMNQKAEELGMSQTHFVNPTGLQDKNHYTTVRDLSVLLQYALQNQTFRKIFVSSRHSTAPTNKHPDGITFNSTLFQNLKNPESGKAEILGGKTGYTEEAGLCLASLAQVNGKEYILVTAGAKGDHTTEQFDIDDAVAVYHKLK